MPTVTLKKVRVGTDLRMKATLTDNGVRFDWASASDIYAFIHSDVQKSVAGRALVSIDPEDSFNLIVEYGAEQAEFLGDNRLVITCTYMGRTVTYDTPVVTFVATSAEEDSDVDETIEAELVVSHIDTSILDNAIAACIAATADANVAAQAALDIVDDVQQKLDDGDFVGEQGPQGEQGPAGLDGGLLFPAFSYDPVSGVFTIAGKQTEVSRFSYDVNTGILTIKLY